MLAAAGLIAKHGYRGVSLGTIGAEAGIVGSGIYRHFETKAAILVELLTGVVDKLVAEAEATLEAGERPALSLAKLVRGQLDFTIEERTLCEIYLVEARSLPEQDLRRLRWKQRHYVDLWQELLRAVHPELAPGQAQVAVHAAISTVHSLLRYHPTLPIAEQAASINAIACKILGVAPVK